ncbi:hypothetical protein [Constantimarinum furrinae]|uniref:Uncharacterized protein n=1 Tax=Constantimarinum furrinae TaxID=2562285 RepID=A0A7G8PXR8_9FLAO|nr:hypothetical protein [Constantimarinum furrinae]QNJ99134.1 hypothetical protein ALE3EI_2605 [Constantimarinum furrinae]
MEIEFTHKSDAHRRLCIQKDLNELSHWIDTLSEVNNEIEHLKVIEKQLLKNNNIETNLLGFRRKNTLVIGMLCKYEQELKTEFDYGKKGYDHVRAKEHEKKRNMYSTFVTEFNEFRSKVYTALTKFRRTSL